MKVVFEMEKDTKNTIRFKEAVGGPLDTPKIGTLYVPKTTLQDIGYDIGKQLVVDISVN